MTCASLDGMAQSTTRPLRATTVALAALAAVATGGPALAGAPTSQPPATEPPTSEPSSSDSPSSSVPFAELFDPAAPFDPSERIVAVDHDGAVVVISVSADGTPGEPFPVFEAGDAFVDGIALDADRSTVFVGVCCSPGTIHVATADEGETGSHDGSAPVSSPDRASLAYVLGTSIVVEDIASGETVTVDTDDGDMFTPFDVTWVGDDRLVVFGADSTQSFEFRAYDVPSGSLAASAPAGEGGQPNFRFAGVDVDGAIVVVDVPLEPTVAAQLVRLDPETLTPLDGPDTATLPPGAMSASINGAATHLVWVDGEGTLALDGRSIPGTYRWAAWA